MTGKAFLASLPLHYVRRIVVVWVREDGTFNLSGFFVARSPSERALWKSLEGICHDRMEAIEGVPWQEGRFYKEFVPTEKACSWSHGRPVEWVRRALWGAELAERWEVFFSSREIICGGIEEVFD